MKVIIDPRCNYMYSSYYIQGLIEVFGQKNISYSMKYFRQLNMKAESHSFDHYFAFVIINSKYSCDFISYKKIIVDFRDKNTIKENAYNWCDIYAKVNFNKELTDSKFFPKIISIPPSFGVRVYGFAETVLLAISNLIKSNFSISTSIKNYILNYIFTFMLRAPINKYIVPQKSLNDYIFFISSLRTDDICINKTNKLRYLFIKKAKNDSILFEGGFKGSIKNPEYEKYKDAVFTKRYSINDYIKKSKESCVVFNTPAVHNCHGWKLGEFLAMGKAIISTTLSNDLPENLKHGINIHFVKDDKDIEDAIKKILNNTDYKETLENNSKIYFDKIAAPANVIKTIFTSAYKGENNLAN